MLEQIFSAGFWSLVYFGNSLRDYAVALGSFVVFLVVFDVAQRFTLRYLKKLARRTKTDIDDTFIKIVQKIRPPFYSFLAFWLAINFIKISPFFQKVLNIVLTVWVVYLAVNAVGILIDYMAKRYLGEEKGKGTAGAIELLSRIAKGILWALGVLFVLSNLGVNVTSLVAGLGIGGVAVALALQNILGDLFSSFAIFFDKPFVEGDFIVVGEHLGTVKKIGVKTTRIQALQGEEIVIPNKELTSSRVQNFKRMKERRVMFAFGVVYETTSGKLEEIPKIVEGTIKSVKKARFDRAHFKNFDDYALTFEVVYYVLSADYNQYMDINQKILFMIKREFEKRKIVMAYPTQTVYLAK